MKSGGASRLVVMSPKGPLYLPAIGASIRCHNKLNKMYTIEDKFARYCITKLTKCFGGWDVVY